MERKRRKPDDQYRNMSTLPHTATAKETAAQKIVDVFFPRGADVGLAQYEKVMAILDAHDSQIRRQTLEEAIEIAKMHELRAWSLDDPSLEEFSKGTKAAVEGIVKDLASARDISTTT